MHQLAEQRPGISLKALLSSPRFFGASDIVVRSCCGNWKDCQPGDLFIAVDGPEDDGHHEIMRAVQQGAAAVVAERLVPVSVPVCVVSDSRHAYGEICQALAGNPCESLQTIGVTGTSGKTVTCHLIQSIFQAAQRTTGLLTSIASFDGQQTFPARDCDAAPPWLAQRLAEMRLGGCSHAVAEVDSLSLAQRQLAGVQLETAVITNVRRDHLDFHGNVRNYRTAKSKLLDLLKPTGLAVLNADDPICRQWLDELEVPVLSYGMHHAAEVTGELLERCASEQTILIHAGSESIPVRTEMIGEHHLANCLAAATVALAQGIELPAIARGLEQVGHIPGRMERIECGQAFATFVDNAATPDQLAASLKALRQITRGKLICVYGASENGPRDDRALIGRTVERGAALGVITRVDPQSSQPLKVAHDILDGYQRPGRAHVLPDRVQAIQWALEQAGEGDTVLVAGRGEREYPQVKDTVLAVDDRDVCRQWLYGFEGSSPQVKASDRPVSFDIRDYFDS